MALRDILWVVDFPTRKDANGNEIGLTWKTFKKGIEISMGGVALRSNLLNGFD